MALETRMKSLQSVFLLARRPSRPNPSRSIFFRRAREYFKTEIREKNRLQSVYVHACMQMNTGLDGMDIHPSEETSTKQIFEQTLSLITVTLCILRCQTTRRKKSTLQYFTDATNYRNCEKCKKISKPTSNSGFLLF